MKRILMVLMALAVAVGPAVEAGAAEMANAAMTAERPAKDVKSGEVIDLIKNYKSDKGFNVVSVGSFGLGFMKMMAKASAKTEEDKAAVDFMNGIEKIVAVEYDDAAPARKTDFNSRLTKLLESAEKVMEVKDGGETVNIYGTSADHGESIDDLIIFIPEECALVCLFGSISAKSIADLMEASK